MWGALSASVHKLIIPDQKLGYAVLCNAPTARAKLLQKDIGPSFGRICSTDIEASDRSVRRLFKMHNRTTRDVGVALVVGLILSLGLAISFSGFGCSSATGPRQQASKQTSPESNQKGVSPRDILGNQPDFVADEVFFQFEPRVHGGFSLANKLAKKGSYYRSEDYDGTVRFFRPNKSTVYYNGKRIYREEVPSSSDERWYQEAIHVQILVREQNLTFKEVGREVIEGHDCLRIKASKNSGDGSNPTVLFYAARDLKNLVIAVEEFVCAETSEHYSTLNRPSRTRRFTPRHFSSCERSAASTDPRR